jgi:hypothetical protein
MTQHTGIIEFVSHKYDKYAIKLEGQEGWYNTKQEYADEWDYKPKQGDEVTFDDGGKKYFSKHKVLKQSAGVAPSGGKSKGGGWSNVGVEVGHASNLAMRVMEQRLAGVASEPTVGSTEYWKQFAQDTMKIHGLMAKIKDSVEGKTEAVPAKEAEPAQPEVYKSPDPVKSNELDDIF